MMKGEERRGELERADEIRLWGKAPKQRGFFSAQS